MTGIGKALVFCVMMLLALGGCGGTGPAAPMQDIRADLPRFDAEVIVSSEVVFADAGRQDLNDSLYLEMRFGDTREDVWSPIPCNENSDCESGFCLCGCQAPSIK